MSNFRTGGFLNKNGEQIIYQEDIDGYKMFFNHEKFKARPEMNFDEIADRLRYIQRNMPCTIRGKKYPCETIEFEMI